MAVRPSVLAEGLVAGERAGGFSGVNSEIMRREGRAAEAEIARYKRELAEMVARLDGGGPAKAASWPLIEQRFREAL